MRAAIGWFLGIGLGLTGCGLQGGPMVKTEVAGDRQAAAIGQPASGERTIANISRGPGMGRWNPGSMGQRPPGGPIGRRPPWIGPRRPPRIPGGGPGVIIVGPGQSYPPESYYPPTSPGYTTYNPPTYTPPTYTPPASPPPTYTPPPAMSASPYGSREDMRQAAWQNWWRNTDEGRKDYWQRVLQSDPYGGKSPMEDPEAAGINFATSPTGKKVTPPTTGWPPVP